LRILPGLRNRLAWHAEQQGDSASAIVERFLMTLPEAPGEAD
jgi:hypothetical protein